MSLSVGTHTITASVTDSGGLTGTATVTVTVVPASGLTLSVSARKVKNTKYADLAWQGSAAGSVDVFRGGHQGHHDVRQHLHGQAAKDHDVGHLQGMHGGNHHLLERGDGDLVVARAPRLRSL